ncbi:vitamin B12-dependent ribonucleotide reductase [candidate division KSB1 bacterium]
MELTENSKKVLEKRYLLKDDTGEIIETHEEMFRRVAKCAAEAEKEYDPDYNAKNLEDKFYGMIARLEFMPNSPTLMNAGKDQGQLSACFVLPVEDSMEGIFDSIKNAALIHKTGGGTGFAFSRLRPKNDVVLSTHGVASGPVSFMRVFDSATEAVKQGGTRRGANMGILRIDHPDILEFITCKFDNNRVNNFNISVALTEDFMDKVENDGEYDLISPRSKKVINTLSAGRIFDLIVNMAWKNGDPGIIFLDRINKDNPTPEVGEIESTNPCGEQPLLPFEACNLGSLNLHKMLQRKNGKCKIDYDKLRKTVHNCIHFLDNIIDANYYPLPEIDTMVKENRKIGLGIMGFADMLIELEIPYDSKEALEIGEEVMSFINKESKVKSMELAQKKGAFPNFENSIYGKTGLPQIRNATNTTIAPTGTISIISNCSSGIEPIFAVSYYRNVMDNEILVEVNPLFERIAKECGFYSEELMKKIAEHGTVQDIEEVPEEIRKLFVTAHDISPEAHIRMQAAFQKHCDNAVSKTVNFSNDCTADDISKVYKLAYELGCKGVTVYRDRCRETQVLNIAHKEEEKPIEVESGKTFDRQETVRDEESKIIPRKRGKITYGATEKIVTSDGTLYVTINQDEFGLCEVFTNIGKHGSDAAAWSEAVGRLISLCLRSGVSLRSIVKQLRGITSRPIWQDGIQILSVPDAIGRALSRYVNDEGIEIKIPISTGQNAAQEVLEEHSFTIDQKTEFSSCPDCGSPVEHEGGCMVCRSCGFSRCG